MALRGIRLAWVGDRQYRHLQHERVDQSELLVWPSGESHCHLPDHYKMYGGQDGA